NDRFGYAVAVEGNTVLAGAYRANATTTGAAYSYVLHDSRHSERQKLVAADGVANDQFGSAVALDGDTLAVGADRERGGQGAVYVFTRTGTAPNTAWAFQQKIFAADAATNDSFGYSVALSGDTLAVGTPNDDISHEDQGSAYIFNRSSGRWTFQTKLLAADSVGLENFGSAVALDGDTVIVGAPRGKRNPSRSPNEGAAYVFTRTGTNWMFQAKLFANDGEHDDFFGGAVALDSDTVAVGAPLDEIGTNLRQGSVYLFTRTGGLWSFRQKLLTEANPFAEFGRSVALAGVARDSDTLVVGAPFEKIGEHNYQGAAYVFRRNGDTWVRTQKLFDRDGASGDLFGFSVALSGDTLVAGTRPNDRIGAAFVYTQLGQFWYPQPKLTAGDGAASDYFGRSVAVSGDTIAVGASLDDSPTQRDQGSVYIFAGALCPPLSIAPASLPNGAIGSAYNQQLTGSGDSGVGDYLFSVAGGTLPPGLTLTPGTGVLAGTPTAAGTWRFTINTRFSLSLCAGSRTFTLTITSACAAITVNPATLPNGTAGTMYNQTLTASGGVAPYTFAVSTGSLPNGLSLAANGALTGTPIVAGTFNFTAQAGDANGCQGTRAYSVTITQGGGGTTGLQFYPLAHPIRLLETRAGQSGCFTPGAPIAAGTSRTQPARGVCDGLTIPANALAVTGNITTVNSGGGFLTLYPSNAAQPLVANSNYAPNEVLNNVFTVGLGNDGAFKIFALNTTDVVVDVTGYYAPPSAGGLYFHPLPKPIRLLETRSGFTGCFAPGTRLQAGSVNAQLGQTTCGGVTIPAGAQALVGNATTVNPQNGGYLTLYPANAAQPLTASSNFLTGQIINAPFTVGLSPSGQFNIFTTTTTDLVVDVLGYYSAQLNDANGAGLLLYSLPAPTRLLDTRAGQAGCFTPNAPLFGGAPSTQPATGNCTAIPATAKAVVGNATVVNAQGGFLTFWPSNAAQPLVATSNFLAGQVFNRHFTVGLGTDGAFKMFASATTDLVIDVSGYFAP
ncbi:MAG TPA: putative Ig domain-containing protein, partial [Blastocatellia bacterium]|nr:putative Ig domain-containing protein [Blastocatellia bacterium]